MLSKAALHQSPRYSFQGNLYHRRLRPKSSPSYYYFYFHIYMHRREGGVLECMEIMLKRFREQLVSGKGGFKCTQLYQWYYSKVKIITIKICNIVYHINILKQPFKWVGKMSSFGTSKIRTNNWKHF